MGAIIETDKNMTFLCVWLPGLIKSRDFKLQQILTICSTWAHSFRLRVEACVRGKTAPRKNRSLCATRRRYPTHAQGSEHEIIRIKHLLCVIPHTSHSVFLPEFPYSTSIIMRASTDLKQQKRKFRRGHELQPPIGLLHRKIN